MEWRAADGRPDRERERRGGADEEAAREQGVEPPPLDREADPGQHGHDRAGEHDEGLEHEAGLGHAVRGAEARVGHEQRKRGPQEPEQEHLAPQERVERASAVLFHRHPCRHGHRRR